MPTLCASQELHQNVPPGWYYESINNNLLQRFWHKRRFKEVCRIVEPANAILDIGAADGVFTELIARRSNATKAIGIDVLPDCVAWANQHWVDRKELAFQLGDVHSLEFPDGCFDAVFALESLEHIFDPKKAMAEIFRVLRPGGYAVFLVPSDNMCFRVVWYLWIKFRGRIWKDTHIQSFHNNGLLELVTRHECDIVDQKSFLLGMLQLLKIRKI